MENIKVPNNKYHHKLIVLISTLNYINSNLEHLYKLGTVFKITNNYYKHLGINMGTEVYYKFKYSKKECHRILNKHFKDIKKNKYKIRVNSYFKKNCIKNSRVEKRSAIVIYIIIRKKEKILSPQKNYKSKNILKMQLSIKYILLYFKFKIRKKKIQLRYVKC